MARAGRERARSWRSPASAPGPLSRVHPIDGPFRSNRTRGWRTHRTRRLGRGRTRNRRCQLRSSGGTRSSSSATGPPPGREVQKSERHRPVCDDAVRGERADDQAHPEQGDQDAKHGDPFFRVFRGHRNAPVTIHEGKGGNDGARRVQVTWQPPGELTEEEEMRPSTWGRVGSVGRGDRRRISKRNKPALPRCGTEDTMRRRADCATRRRTRVWSAVLLPLEMSTSELGPE
jgi:hypothetical protein